MAVTAVASCILKSPAPGAGEKSGDTNALRFWTLLAFGGLELDGLTVLETPVAIALDV